jgi:hypothetical protein
MYIMGNNIKSQRNNVLGDIKMSCVWREGTIFLEKC